MPRAYSFFFFQEKSLTDKWADEFTQSQKDQTAEPDIDFWDKLQKQWEEMARFV